MFAVNKNRGLRQTLIVLLVPACLLLGGLLLYLRSVPQITVRNHSEQRIEEVVIQLPSSRVVFDAIAPDEAPTIRYSMRQSDGDYRYTIRFPADLRLVGSCGDVTHGELGKRLELIDESPTHSECRETAALF